MRSREHKTWLCCRKIRESLRPGDKVNALSEDKKIGLAQQFTLRQVNIETSTVGYGVISNTVPYASESPPREVVP
jgi:hypothetical protein